MLGFELIDAVGSVTFADPSPGMLAQVTRKIHERGCTTASTVLLDDAADLPGFDLIVSLMVLHHIDDVAATVAKLGSWLRPGGYLGLSDLDREDGSFHRDEVVPHQGFDRSFIAGLLTGQGLRVVETSTVFVIRKVALGIPREYPVFLAIGALDP